MCTGHPFLFSTHRSYSKQLSPFSPAPSNFPYTRSFPSTHKICCNRSHSKRQEPELHILFQLLSHFSASFYISLKKNLSIFTLSLISFSLEHTPNRLSPSPFHWSSWYHDHWWPSCCQTQWSTNNLRVIQPAAAFNTVYHSFVKYLSLLISRDLPSQFCALLTGCFSISPASDVGVPWAPCLMFILCSLRQRMRWLDGVTDSMDMSLSKLWEMWRTGKPGVLQSMGSQRARYDWVTELNWCILIL